MLIFVHEKKIKMISKGTENLKYAAPMRRTFARYSKEEEKKDGRGKTDSRGRKLTFRFESVGPAHILFLRQSRRKTGGNSCTETRKKEQSRRVWRRGDGGIREERKSRLTGSTFIQAISSRAGRTRRNIDSHVGGIDYDPPYPPTPRSIARLWINGWDDRFILIRINANLSTNACTYACITTDNNTTQGGTRISVPFHFAITLEPLKLSSSKGCMMVIRHSRERGLKIMNMNLCTRHVRANSIAHNAGKIILY